MKRHEADYKFIEEGKITTTPTLGFLYKKKRHAQGLQHG